jgi:hypothetical protein
MESLAGRVAPRAPQNVKEHLSAYDHVFLECADVSAHCYELCQAPPKDFPFLFFY